MTGLLLIRENIRIEFRSVCDFENFQPDLTRDRGGRGLCAKVKKRIEIRSYDVKRQYEKRHDYSYVPTSLLPSSSSSSPSPPVEGTRSR